MEYLIPLGSDLSRAAFEYWAPPVVPTQVVCELRVALDHVHGVSSGLLLNVNEAASLPSTS